MHIDKIVKYIENIVKYKLTVSKHIIHRTSHIYTQLIMMTWYSYDIPYIANRSRWKSFTVAELNYNSLENLYSWTVV